MDLKLDKVITTPHYRVQLADLPGGLFYAGFEIHRAKYSPQLNLSNNGHTIVIIEETPKPYWLRCEQAYFSEGVMSAIYAPPNSIIDWVLPPGISTLQTFCTREASVFEWGLEFPFVFNYQADHLPQSPQEFKDIVASSQRKYFMGNNPRPDSLARKVRERLTIDYDKALKMTDLAKELGTTRENLSRLFKKSYGMQIQEFRKQLRVNASMAQLTLSKSNVTDAAFDSGFDNLANYFRQFRKMHDATPKSFQL